LVVAQVALYRHTVERIRRQNNDDTGTEPVRADIANSDVCGLPPLLRSEWHRTRRPRWV